VKECGSRVVFCQFLICEYICQLLITLFWI